VPHLPRKDPYQRLVLTSRPWLVQGTSGVLECQGVPVEDYPAWHALLTSTRAAKDLAVIHILQLDKVQVCLVDPFPNALQLLGWQGP